MPRVTVAPVSTSPAPQYPHEYEKTTKSVPVRRSQVASRPEQLSTRPNEVKIMMGKPTGRDLGTSIRKADVSRGATKSRRRWERKGINSNNHQHSATIVVLKMQPSHKKLHFVWDQIPKLKCYLSGTSIVSAHQMIPARKKIWYHLYHLHTTRRRSLLA